MSNIIKLEYRLCGIEKDKDLELRDIIRALDEYHGILDKVYLGMSGKERLTKKEKDIFSVKYIGFNKGSYIFRIGVFLYITATQLSLLPSPVFVELMQEVSSFLRFIFDARKNNETLTYEDGDGPMITVKGKKNSIKVNYNVIHTIGPKAYPHYKEMDDLLDENGISKISAYADSLKQPLLDMDYKEKGLYQLEAEMDETMIEINGDIYRYDKIENKGKINICKGEDIALGSYNFEVVGNNNVRDYIDAMGRWSGKFLALKELTINPFTGEKTVKKIHIVKIKK